MYVGLLRAGTRFAKCIVLPDVPRSLITTQVFMIMGLSYIMVDCAIRMGTILTIEPFIMGLLVLSAGTSIPDTLSALCYGVLSGVMGGCRSTLRFFSQKYSDAFFAFSGIVSVALD